MTTERKRPSLSGADEGYMPLAVMNTFAQEWVIKVKVMKKLLKNWNNTKGSGTLLNLELMDKDGIMI